MEVKLSPTGWARSVYASEHRGVSRAVLCKQRASSERSIPRVTRRSREGNRIAYVGQAGDVSDRALKAEAETSVRNGAVAAQVAVPGVMLLIDSALGHARIEHLGPLFPLAAADDLADPGCQHVHRRDSSAVVVDAHVERLDALGIVHHDDRLLRVLLGEVTLVLGLKVDAPFHRELEFLLRPLEYSDRVGVVHAHEF